MAQYDDEAPPPGYRYHYFGDPASGTSGRYPVPIETPIGDGSGRPIAPHREVAGEVPGTGPSLDQMKFELSQQQQPQQTQTPSLPDYLANLPREIRDQVMALGEVGLSMFTSMISPPVGAVAGVGKNLYDYVTKGKIDPAASKDFANTAAGMVTYQPTLPSAQSIMQVMGEAPAYFMGTGQGLPPIVSGINPRALQTPRGTVGALGQGIRRDISQFDNDVFNAQRGITPGYPTMGSEFSSAFVNPKPSVYEMLAGLEPSNVPSTASAAVKPVGRGVQASDLGKPFPSLENYSGMTQELSDRYKHTGITNAIRNWRDDYTTKLGRIDWRVEQAYEDGLRDYKTANKPIDPATGQPHKGSLQDDVIYRLTNEYTKIWNEQHRAEPEKQVTSPERFELAAQLENAWRTGPRKKYIETKMGTGVATDPLLAQVEQTGIRFHDEMTDADRLNSLNNANSNRADAALLHGEDPNSYKGPMGVGEYKYPLVGTRTAVTPAGKEYEDLIDRYINTTTKNSTYAPYATPEQLSYITDTAPIYDINAHIGDHPLSAIDERFRQDALAGRIKLENVNQISPERIALQLLKEKQAEIAKAKKSNDALKVFKLERLSTLPGQVFPGTGNKLIIFNKAMVTDPASEHMMVRDLSTDCYDLDHCVAHAGKPPQRLTDDFYDTDEFKKRHYRPLVIPHTGKEPPNAAYYPNMGSEPPEPGRPHGHTPFTRGVEQGTKEIASLRDPAGNVLVTSEISPPDKKGEFDVVQVQGYQDGGVDDSGPKDSGRKAITPEAAQDMVTWFNENAKKIGYISIGQGLNKLQIADMGRAFTHHSNPMHNSGLDEINPSWDHKQVKTIIDEYNADAAVTGSPLAPRFLTGDQIKAIIAQMDMTPYALPTLDPADHLTNATTLTQYITKFEKLKHQVSLGADTANNLADVERHIATLKTAREQENVLHAEQLKQRRAATQGLSTTFSDQISRLAASNITDPNFSFNLDSLPIEFRTLGHALMGNIYSPSSQLPPALHKKVIDTVLSHSSADVRKLATAVREVHYHDPTNTAVLTQHGLTDVANLTDAQKHNLSDILMSFDNVSTNTQGLAVPDYSPYFVQVNDLVNSAKTIHTNENIHDQTINLQTALAEFENMPQDQGARSDALRAGRNFRHATQETLNRHLDFVTNFFSPIDINAPAYIKDRVHPDLRDDALLLSQLVTNPVQGTSLPELREFADRYTHNITDSMYNSVDMHNVYKQMTQIDKFPASVVDNGKAVLRQFAQKRLLPEQFAAFTRDADGVDAHFQILRDQYNVPADMTVPAFMREEVTPASDPMRVALSGIHTGLSELRRGPITTVDEFVRQVAAQHGLNTKEQFGIQVILGDDGVQLAPGLRAKLNSVILDDHPSYGEVNGFITRVMAEGWENEQKVKALTVLNNFMKLRGADLSKVVNSYLASPDLAPYVQIHPNIPNMANGGRVRRMADGGAVTDTLDKMVKNPQASTLLNLDLPNLIAAKQQVRAMKRGGKVEFSNNIDDMRYALTRR